MSIGNEPLPRIVKRYTQWLIGNERGCRAACRCRPTAHRARQILAMVRWAIRASGCCDGIFAMMRTTDALHPSSVQDGGHL